MLELISFHPPPPQTHTHTFSPFPPTQLPPIHITSLLLCHTVVCVRLTTQCSFSFCSQLCPAATSSSLFYFFFFFFPPHVEDEHTHPHTHTHTHPLARTKLCSVYDRNTAPLSFEELYFFFVFDTPPPSLIPHPLASPMEKKHNKQTDMFTPPPSQHSATQAKTHHNCFSRLSASPPPCGCSLLRRRHEGMSKRFCLDKPSHHHHNLFAVIACFTPPPPPPPLIPEIHPPLLFFFGAQVFTRQAHPPPPSLPSPFPSPFFASGEHPST